MTDLMCQKQVQFSQMREAFKKGSFRLKSPGMTGGSQEDAERHQPVGTDNLVYRPAMLRCDFGSRLLVIAPGSELRTEFSTDE